MAWIAVGIAVVGVATSVYGASQTRKAGKAAEQLGGVNAAYIQQETAEEARRLKFEQQKTRATSRATIAASGFRSGVSTMGFSQKEYMSQLQRIQSSELAWLQLIVYSFTTSMLYLFRFNQHKKKWAVANSLEPASSV
ncbi:MAG: hypothetical protein K940chlam6_00629 [Chlamydiae bacterium]|nr:hypothetical protein [Chlamydiota bacterium]